VFLIGAFVAGAAMMSAWSILQLGKASDGMCMGRQWGFHLSFTMMFGPLFLKTWRAYQIFENPTLRRKIITNRSMVHALLSLLAVDIVLLVLWTALDPIKAEPVKHSVVGVGEFELVECVGLNRVFSIILIAFKALMTVLGCYCSYRARKTNEVFAESEHIMIAVYLVAVLSAFALVLVFVIGVTIASQTILLSIWSALISVTTVTLVVLPKIIHRRLTRKEIIMGTRTTGSTGGTANSVARVDFGHHSQNAIIPLQPRRAGQNHSAAKVVHSHPPKSHPTALISEGHVTSAGEETDVTDRKGAAAKQQQQQQVHHRSVAGDDSGSKRSQTRPNVVHNGLVTASMSGSQQNNNSATQNSSSATFVSASKCVV
jgi:hypothetical protein